VSNYVSVPLNFFEPYERLPAGHENQLTRALLVVLRYCPMAHQAWISRVDRGMGQSLIDRGMRLHELPSPTFRTQDTSVLGKGFRKPTDETLNESIKGISVLCAADAPEGSTATVGCSERGMVLDAIVRYDNDLVIVMESKLDGPGDPRQAEEINLHGQPVHFDPKVCRISWRDVLSDFDALADDERAVTAGAERIILRDFLEFVDRNFPRLGPFNTLQSCAGEPSRIMRRLRTIMGEEIAGEAVSFGGITLPGRHSAVISAHITTNGEGEKQTVRLEMFPADTLEQARAFYRRSKALERILALESQGWRISPNFHFGFMAKGLSWTKATASVDEYVRHWEENIGETRQVDRADWPTFWERLVTLGFAVESDRELFDRDFTNTNRNFASPRPGLRCSFDWPFEEAERLDSERNRRFGPAIKERINELLVAIDEPPV
jgi:hypothetical protein